MCIQNDCGIWIDKYLISYFCSIGTRPGLTADCEYLRTDDEREIDCSGALHLRGELESREQPII